MSRVSVFSSPFLVGFDNFEERVDRLAKSADGYPPYNIERVRNESGEAYEITIAVAGFSEADLDVISENNQIVVRGKQQAETERDYLHRGIATRQFQRSFLLADGMSVEGAALSDGMLRIKVFRPEPATRTKRIKIKTV